MEAIGHDVQYMPGDQRLVEQILYELKSKGIFDQVSYISKLYVPIFTY